MRPGLGVIAAAIAMYLFGFVYWGASSFPYAPWLETSDDRVAGQALLEHFPESGVYFVPGRGNAAEERVALHDAGPVAFVYIDREGRPEFDPGLMVRGFLLNGLIAALMLWLFRLTGMKGHGSRAGLAAVVALTIVAVVHVGDIVWWVLPVGWEISRALYNSVAFVLGAVVLSGVLGADSEM